MEKEIHWNSNSLHLSDLYSGTGEQGEEGGVEVTSILTVT